MSMCNYVSIIRYGICWLGLYTCKRLTIKPTASEIVSWHERIAAAAFYPLCTVQRYPRFIFCFIATPGLKRCYFKSMKHVQDFLFVAPACGLSGFKTWLKNVINTGILYCNRPECYEKLCAVFRVASEKL